MDINNKMIVSKKVTAAIAASLLIATSIPSAPASAAEKVILNSNFENSTDGWTNIGNCNVMQATWTKHNGNKSLYIANRKATFNGALYNLSGKVQAGNTYTISTYWMSWQINNNEDVKLTLTYKDNLGNTKYSTIAKNTASCGQWTNLNGTFTLPNDANQPAIYFETSKTTCDLYIDDIKISEISNDTQDPTEDSSSMKKISDAYMKNIKIVNECPSNNLIKRNNVSYGSFVHKTYYSSTTKSNRGVNILLPANYNPQKKYPVLYVLHGIFQDENSLLSNNISEIVANQVADGNAKEMIVVLPNIYASTNGVSPSFTPEGIAGYNNFINDLENDLMPYIKNNYSISTAREDQAIAGFSMGGRQALYIGITRPDLFGYVMGISPAPGLTPGQDWAMYHSGQLQESELKIANPANTPYAIMVCCGTNDSVVGKFPESYHNILNRNNQNHIWYTVPGADHDGKAICSGINNFVAAIFHAKDTEIK